VRGKGGQSAVFILGVDHQRTSLANRTAIQEVLGIDERGHDYFLQVTDARPDTGRLVRSNARRSSTVVKVDPDRLPDAVVVMSTQR